MAMLWAEKVPRVSRYCVGEGNSDNKTTVKAFTQLKMAWNDVPAFSDRMLIVSNPWRCFQWLDSMSGSHQVIRYIVIGYTQQQNAGGYAH